MKQRRLNLIPKDALPERGFRKEHGIALLFTALFSYILISLPLLTSNLKKQKAELASLEQENAKLKKLYTQLSQEAAPQNSEADQMTVFRKLVTERSEWGKTFQELSLLPVQNVWLNHLKSQRSEKANLLTLKGMALVPSEISTYFTALEKSYYFRNVRLKSVEQAAGVTPRQYSFEFQIEIPVPGRTDTRG